MEMVVVMLVDFVSVHFSWKRHHLDQTISDQGFDVPVNRGQAEVGHGFLSLRQQLLRQKRPT